MRPCYTTLNTEGGPAPPEAIHTRVINDLQHGHGHCQDQFRHLAVIMVAVLFAVAEAATMAEAMIAYRRSSGRLH